MILPLISTRLNSYQLVYAPGPSKHQAGVGLLLAAELIPCVRAYKLSASGRLCGRVLDLKKGEQTLLVSAYMPTGLDRAPVRLAGDRLAHDLYRELDRWARGMHRVIVMGDLNETLTPADRSMALPPAPPAPPHAPSPPPPLPPPPLLPLLLALREASPSSTSQHARLHRRISRCAPRRHTRTGLHSLVRDRAWHLAESPRLHLESRLSDRCTTRDLHRHSSEAAFAPSAAVDGDASVRCVSHVRSARTDRPTAPAEPAHRNGEALPEIHRAATIPPPTRAR